MISCRFEVYLGDKRGPDNDSLDTKTGPAAVVRNMHHVLTAALTAWRVIVVDKFYNRLPFPFNS